MSTPLSKAKAEPRAPGAGLRPARSTHLAAAEGALVRVDDVFAGYVPGVNILNGCDLHCGEGSWSASSARTAPASRPC
jgi:branched-chain amino acid transport system ATP-binding protein